MDVILKAVKTFIQAFIATVFSYGVIDPTDKGLSKSLIIAGVAGGLSALMNIDYDAIKGVKKDKDKTDSDDPEVGEG